METPNAFVGRTDQPTEKEVSAALGKSAAVWRQLIEDLAEQHGVTFQEWNSYSPKYGWTLRLKLKKRTIIHLSPCIDCFRAAFIMGDKAVAAVLASDLPKRVAQIVRDAPHYPEGTGIRLLVKRTADLPAIRKLALAKLQN
jgi:Protein of unknown function (DUF3788)